MGIDTLGRGERQGLRLQWVEERFDYKTNSIGHGVANVCCVSVTFLISLDPLVPRNIMDRIQVIVWGAGLYHNPFNWQSNESLEVVGWGYLPSIDIIIAVSSVRPFNTNQGRPQATN